MAWGADTQDLDKALSLARYAGHQVKVQELERALGLVRQACSHVPNPERLKVCYKCGQDLKPGLAKAAPEIGQARKAC